MEDRLNIFRSVPSLATLRSNRVQKSRKFALPVPESVNFNAGNLAGHADARQR